MVILFDDRRQRILLNRLKGAGLSIASAADLLGMGRNQGYHINNPGESLRIKSASINRLDKAEELLERGYPIDLVARLTGVSASRLLYFLEDLEGV